MYRPKGKTHVAVSALVCAAVLAGCADPMSDVQTLDDVELAQDVDRAELGGTTSPDEPILRPGLLGALFGGGAAQGEQTEAIDAAVTSALAPEEVPALPENTAETAETEALSQSTEDKVENEATAAPQEVAAAAPRGRFRLFGGLFDAPAAPASKAQTEQAEAAPEPAADEIEPSEPSTEMQQAALDAPATETPATKTPTATPRQAGFRLFGLGRRSGAGSGGSDPSSATEAADVTPGAPLSFGAVGRVCEVRGKALGREVERFPEKRSAYTLYDTAPGSTEARAFYITGFSDGCARQVTAANVIFGAPSMHERLRYGLPADTLPASRTDEAYKTLKAKVCGVRRNQPCGARIDKLEANTVFVTMYQSFTGNRNWSNLLLHDGALYASDIKQMP
ncbi:hypothetical protein [Primorskyibacter sp. S187A]|uniref:hypothetical protein n=1 Tax=Primorskyibacter sp. S187A TaxID=3415130 RepID=UPI003C7E3563